MRLEITRLLEFDMARCVLARKFPAQGSRRQNFRYVSRRSRSVPFSAVKNLLVNPSHSFEIIWLSKTAQIVPNSEGAAPSLPHWEARHISIAGWLHLAAILPYDTVLETKADLTAIPGVPILAGPRRLANYHCSPRRTSLRLPKAMTIEYPV